MEIQRTISPTAIEIVESSHQNLKGYSFKVLVEGKKQLVIAVNPKIQDAQIWEIKQNNLADPLVIYKGSVRLVGLYQPQVPDSKL